eukprot:TRINITY_DN3723_c0_g1_i1.p1 TRINITY_DN3723_c0_g1~~TRINITY_DN3723_c0_g1_i1.p1  ORF type:complete len:266 (-),score=66.19 TRINITY_DN3723_c0_g1_i1:80-877(-)
MELMPPTVKVEVCVDSVASTVAARQANADRVELCSALFEGGLTPSAGLIQQVKKALIGSTTRLFVMIRPRGGDFCYDADEFAVMKHDIEYSKSCGVDGVVFGILLPDASVDTERTRQLVDLARPLQVTFHRAFDMVRDPLAALDDIVRLGIERILTSGCDSTCLEGLDTLKTLIQVAKDRVIVVPGGGITERNVHRIVSGSGAREFHVSGRVKRDSVMTHRNTLCFMGGTLRPPEFEVSVVHPAKIQTFLHNAQQQHTTTTPTHT